MDDMTVKKDTLLKLSGADLSKSFPGALYSPSKKPAPLHDPPPKRLSLLSPTDDDLQPLSWLVSPNLLHNVCGRPTQTNPPPQKRIIRRPEMTKKPGNPLMSHFKLKPRHCSERPKCAPMKAFSAIKLTGRIIKQEPADHTIHHPYKMINRIQPNKSLKAKYKKPHYSFATLIFMALEDSISKKLPVKDIYSWILERFPYYQLCDKGWKNSVRHNLSLNRSFKRVDKDRRLECGRGSWWTVDPVLRPDLLHAFKKIGNITPAPIGNENITPPTSPLFHTPPSSPTAEEAAAKALCLMRRNVTRNSECKRTAAPNAGVSLETPSNSTAPSSSESSPELVPPRAQLRRLPVGPKRSIIIDKKSAEGVWALLEMANSRPNA